MAILITTIEDYSDEDQVDQESRKTNFTVSKIELLTKDEMPKFIQIITFSSSSKIQEVPSDTIFQVTIPIF